MTTGLCQGWSLFVLLPMFLCCFLKLCSIPPYLWMVLHCLWLRANISHVDRSVSAFLSFFFRTFFSLTFFIDATRELTRHKIRCRSFQWKIILMKLFLIAGYVVLWKHAMSDWVSCFNKIAVLLSLRIFLLLSTLGILKRLPIF